MEKHQVPDDIIESIRPGDKVCIWLNGMKVWCLVLWCQLGKDLNFLCEVFGSEFNLNFDRFIVKRSQIINVAAGLNHNKPWRS